MTTLVELYDKMAQEYTHQQGFSDKWMPYHTYAHFYELLFRDMKHINMLEIGIWRGGSMMLWKNYFPSYRLVGLDIADLIADQYREPLTTDPNITLMLNLDSTRESSAATVDARGGFDCIIDDGDHSVAAQTNTFRYFWPKLKMGGSYIIEDVLGPASFELLSTNIKNMLGNAYLDIFKYENKQILGREDDLILYIPKK